MRVLEGDRTVDLKKWACRCNGQNEEGSAVPKVGRHLALLSKLQKTKGIGKRGTLARLRGGKLSVGLGPSS